MKCPSCGFVNEDDSKFCKSCGGNMAGAAPQDMGAEQSAPPPPPPQSAPPPPFIPKRTGGIDIGDWVSKAFNEVFGDIANYIIITVVVGLLSGLTGGILGGPLFGGALVVIRKKIRGQGKLDVGEVFNTGFANFAQAFLLVFLPLIALGVAYGIIMLILVLLMKVAFIKIIAWIFMVVLIMSLIIIDGLLVPLFGMGLYYIMEENLEFMPAAQKAWALIQKDILQFWIFGIVTVIVAGIGSIGCGVGVLITYPAAMVMMVYLIESKCKPK